MRKLFGWLDANFLRFGVAFALAFVALYPKLPTIYIHHTWVYIRLEDFLIALLVAYYLFRLVRRKVSFPASIGASFILYWVVGLASLIISIIYIGPHVANFFPSVAVLSYLRRIEYMILFFVGVSVITKVKDIHFYFKILMATLVAVLIYGYGQKFYTFIWHWFPIVHEKFNFCFPSFQTGNEEFAKGLPLCLPFDSRMTSTFAGHYDLAGWLVLLIPVIFAVSFTYAWKKKVSLWILGVLSILMMSFTASRIAVVAYFIAMGVTLIIIKQKKAIIPIFAISILCLFTFNSSTIKRIAQTFRTQSVVVDSQGEVVGLANNSLTDEQKQALDQGKKVAVAAAAPDQNVPLGTSYINIPQTTTNVQKTTTAVVQSSLSVTKAKQLNFDYGGVQLSSVSGNFTVKKVLVYDISFTTRLQGEWPNAWNAFLRNPFLGSGFATITLAADNDYLRNLGETGLLGVLSFAFIFLVIGVLMRHSFNAIEDKMVKAFMLGIVGGIVGLFVNAIFYDMFEASKIAETVWLLLGIMGGTLLLVKDKSFSLLSAVREIVTSHFFLMFYVFVILIAITLPFMSNFFVADDFTWLRWAASAVFTNIPRYFTDAQGFFYRPLDKIVMIGLFSFFGFNPEGYHTFFVFLHFAVTASAYALFYKVFKSKLWAFIGAIIFAFGSFHAENIFWISTISITLSTLWMLLGILQFIRFREKSSWVSYSLSLIFSILSVITYEMGVVFMLLCLVADLFGVEKKKKTWWVYAPFLIVDALYLFVRQTSHVAAIAGDYSYNLAHFIPNAIGNKIGYLGLFFFGQSSLGTYTWLRESMRHNNAVIVASVGVTFAALLLILVFWKLIAKSLTKVDKAIFFGFGFALVAALPFIGLGNITERYIYLASVGLIIFFVALVRWLVQSYPSRILITVLTLLFVVFMGNHLWNLYTVGMQWQRAGKITQNTLGFFKTKYPTLTHADTVYVNKLPIREANAWIFPVGFPDGLWFVYGDENPAVMIAKTGEFYPKDAAHPYTFTFEQGAVIEDQP